IVRTSPSSESGLSPRVRGSLLDLLDFAFEVGPIPAGAGEPLPLNVLFSYSQCQRTMKAVSDGLIHFRQRTSYQKHGVVGDDFLWRFPERCEAQATVCGAVSPGHHDASAIQLIVPVSEDFPDLRSHPRAHAWVRIDPWCEFQHRRAKKAAIARLHVACDDHHHWHGQVSLSGPIRPLILSIMEGMTSRWRNCCAARRRVRRSTDSPDFRHSAAAPKAMSRVTSCR